MVLLTYCGGRGREGEGEIMSLLHYYTESNIMTLMCACESLLVGNIFSLFPSLGGMARHNYFITLWLILHLLHFT